MTHVVPHSLRLPHTKSVRDHRKKTRRGHRGGLLPNHLSKRGVVRGGHIRFAFLPSYLLCALHPSGSR